MIAWWSEDREMWLIIDTRHTHTGYKEHISWTVDLNRATLNLRLGFLYKNLISENALVPVEVQETRSVVVI